MPTVRTRCPSCEIITIEAVSLIVRRRPGSESSEAVFECPACASEVIQPLDAKMVPVLIGAGCGVEDWADSDASSAARALHPSQAGQITEDEIEAFVAALDRRDWMRHLED